MLNKLRQQASNQNKTTRKRMINRKAKAFIIDSTRVRRFVTPSY